jgi:hypothetical protein
LPHHEEGCAQGKHFIPQISRIAAATTTRPCGRQRRGRFFTPAWLIETPEDFIFSASARPWSRSLRIRRIAAYCSGSCASAAAEARRTISRNNASATNCTSNRVARGQAPARHAGDCTWRGRGRLAGSRAKLADEVRDQLESARQQVREATAAAMGLRNELAAAQVTQAEAEAAAAELRQADAARKSRGRLVRLRSAWRGGACTTSTTREWGRGRDRSAATKRAPAKGSGAEFGGGESSLR